MRSLPSRLAHRFAVLVLGIVLAAVPAPALAHGDRGHHHRHHHHHGALSKVGHIVVLFQENHSFDNLYGGWEGVNGLADADEAHTAQVKQDGSRFKCLLQVDVNLAAETPADCSDTTGTAVGSTAFTSAFPNAPFRIDAPDRIPADATTCPAPGQSGVGNGVPKGTGLPGGCTRDLVHRFYQEQYQLHGGRQDRYATGSDAAGLTMGYYDTHGLPVYRYLHERDHPRYAIADAFFQGAFGGSFLNHQWLISAQTPVWPNPPSTARSVLDPAGMPVNNYPLYKTDATVTDGSVTAACGDGTPAGLACGDYAVNTAQPWYQPYAPGTPDANRLPPQTLTTIGDELNGAGVSWAWYSGGWSNANGDVGGPGWTNGDNGTSCTDPNALATATYPNCPDKLFQFHHQPFNYFASFGTDTPEHRANRAAHLRDEQEFLALAKGSEDRCELPSVSFVKPLGPENEHPGYASEATGSDHLVDLINAVEDGECADDAMIVVTYDEFGGQWDHVPPPGQGDATGGPHDEWGPGTRIPALVISRFVRDHAMVDHTPHDTTSIVATIEHRFVLAPLGPRDARVADLSSALGHGGHHHHGDDDGDGDDD